MQRATEMDSKDPWALFGRERGQGVWEEGTASQRPGALRASHLAPHPEGPQAAQAGRPSFWTGQAPVGVTTPRKPSPVF